MGLPLCLGYNASELSALQVDPSFQTRIAMPQGRFPQKGHQSEHALTFLPH
jgi:hypothetical protein